ncbi:hypothetical protein Hanom_Chr15g01358501 [Helianthus anomalus]
MNFLTIALRFWSLFLVDLDLASAYDDTSPRVLVWVRSAEEDGSDWVEDRLL